MSTLSPCGVGNDGLLYILWDTEARCRMFGERLPGHDGCSWSEANKKRNIFDSK